LFTNTERNCFFENNAQKVPLFITIPLFLEPKLLKILKIEPFSNKIKIKKNLNLSMELDGPNFVNENYKKYYNLIKNKY
jgi:hypothetical protein